MKININSENVIEALNNAYYILNNNKIHFPHIRDLIEAREDEVALIYSSIFDVPIIKAKEELIESLNRRLDDEDIY